MVSHIEQFPKPKPQEKNLPENRGRILQPGEMVGVANYLDGEEVLTVVACSPDDSVTRLGYTPLDNVDRTTAFDGTPWHAILRREDVIVNTELHKGESDILEIQSTPNGPVTPYLITHE